eukprot:scaffold126150_cov60-Attheya_sp.AAC.4
MTTGDRKPKTAGKVNIIDNCCDERTTFCPISPSHNNMSAARRSSMSTMAMTVVEGGASVPGYLHLTEESIGSRYATTILISMLC